MYTSMKMAAGYGKEPKQKLDMGNFLCKGRCIMLIVSHICSIMALIEIIFVYYIHVTPQPVLIPSIFFSVPKKIICMTHSEKEEQSSLQFTPVNTITLLKLQKFKHKVSVRNTP